MKIYFNLTLLFIFFLISNFSTNAQDFSNTKIRFAVGGGYAYRLFKSDRSLPSQIEDGLRNGYVLDADFQFFFKKTWGLGLNANYIKSEGSLDMYNYSKVSNLFVGPTLSAAYEFRKFLFTGNWGLGMLQRREEMSTMILTNYTLGQVYNVTGELKVTNGLGIGIKLGAVLGNVRVYDENLSGSSLFLAGFLSFRAK